MPYPMFARLFGPDDDQILVTLDHDTDSGLPQLTFRWAVPADCFYQPSVVVTFGDDEDLAMTALQGMTESAARELRDAYQKQTERIMGGDLSGTSGFSATMVDKAGNEITISGERDEDCDDE
ncbi:MAG: hypothetical protein DI604_36575 [Delftia acidovorans]|nr:MAG: hypothetical protein DI604_36575 [Delftia acidovorans]